MSHISYINSRAEAVRKHRSGPTITDLLDEPRSAMDTDNLIAAADNSTSGGDAPPYKTIPLSQGKVARVSPEDYERISQFNWHFCRYAARNVSCKSGGQRIIRMHRVIMDAPDDMEVDHINGDKLDNRRDNLRLCTNAENQKNRPGWGSIKYKGVYPSNRWWRASIMSDGVKYNLGTYPTKRDAAWAYDLKARELHGEFARTNFDDPEPPNYDDWRDRMDQFQENWNLRMAEAQRERWADILSDQEVSP